MSLHDDALTLAPDLVRLRHDLHRFPELGLDLPRTQERVLRALDGLPLEVSQGSALSSVTAVLRGGRPGPVVLLRGDMDGLPVAEKAPLPFAADNGAMHACGHDLHTAMLAGAAHLLAARREQLHGDVVFMFQPGEEGSDGAGAMLAEGVLDAAGRRPVAAYALHVASAMPHGEFGSRRGPILAASDALNVTVHGAGGHGSAPHRAKDPIPAACEMITALQTMVTRRFDVFDPVVVTVGLIQAGTQRNIIPETAYFEATVRTFSAEARSKVADAASELVRAIAAAHGLRAEVEYLPGYPVTVTDGAETDFLADTVRDVFGEERYQPMPNPMTGAEDFSRVLDTVPGSFVWLGAAPKGTDPDSLPLNHSPYAEFDDAVLPDGAALLAELATRRLAA
ncbi:M20 family metallopeptidase [Kitasatospora sp. NBC_01287]|uniref:M20 metallopeptidase family protein n=1 Tax=Kitasatospora sp. NBC_01287 TaxID=2903573 RepID=UPI0022535C52|nr:M20 family metallopeptidase [Kitasatospora sp. NBC_01287]MCX4744196.1 M20 family metallopeptidase [Kitasatospora sp. NBC_01287]